MWLTKRILMSGIDLQHIVGFIAKIDPNHLCN